MLNVVYSPQVTLSQALVTSGRQRRREGGLQIDLFLGNAGSDHRPLGLAITNVATSEIEDTSVFSPCEESIYRDIVSRDVLAIVNEGWAPASELPPSAASPDLCRNMYWTAAVLTTAARVYG